jgi:hypothetical protein
MPFYRFVAHDYGELEYLNELLQGLKAPQQLHLKIGTQVMLVKNIDVDLGLVNGARGIVVDFTLNRFDQFGNELSNLSGHDEIMPIVRFATVVANKKRNLTRTIGREKWELSENDHELASRVQVPLMLAWAISVHKSQGMTIPLLDLSCKGMFEYGQAYVALSRATDLDGLILRNFTPHAIKSSHKVMEFYRLIGLSPIVPSNNPQTVNGEESLVMITFGDLLRLFMRIFELQEYGGNGALYLKKTILTGPPLVKSKVEVLALDRELERATSVRNEVSKSLKFGYKSESGTGEDQVDISTPLAVNPNVVEKVQSGVGLYFKPSSSLSVIPNKVATSLAESLIEEDYSATATHRMPSLLLASSDSYVSTPWQSLSQTIFALNINAPFSAAAPLRTTASDVVSATPTSLSSRQFSSTPADYIKVENASRNLTHEEKV